QGELHLVLSDDRREGVGVAVYRHGQLNVTDDPPRSCANDLGRVQVERPAVVGRCQLVAARLLGPGGVLVLQVVADGRLDLPLRRVETQPEDARADTRVELPRLDVERAAVAQQRCRVAV